MSRNPEQVDNSQGVHIDKVGMITIDGLPDSLDLGEPQVREPGRHYSTAAEPVRIGKPRGIVRRVALQNYLASDAAKDVYALYVHKGEEKKVEIRFEKFDPDRSHSGLLSGGKLAALLAVMPDVAQVTRMYDNDGRYNLYLSCCDKPTDEHPAILFSTPSAN